MASRLHKVIRPLEWEDLRYPSSDEIWDYSKKRIPLLDWLPLTTCDTFKADIVAGITVLVMVIPQSMSYADIAGLPFIYGLYATMLPSLLYAFVGTSRQLAVGPTALVSILTNAALQGVLTEEECPESNLPQNEACPEEYAKLAILLAFITGIIQMAAAMLQLGFIVNFIGHPVISGFTSAAAFLIGLTQVKNILGFKIAKSEYIYVTFGEIFSNIHKTNAVTAVLGFSFVFMLIGTKKIARKYKSLSWLRPAGPLIFSVLGSILVYASGIDKSQNVAVVGTVPEGFPPISTDYNLDDISRVIAPSITIIIISYMESVAISKSLAAQHSYEVDAGQELLASGVMNLFGSMLSAFPVTGSFSRSAVNNSVGAKTQLAGLITGLGVILTLAVLTPIFAYLPKFVLGAIVVSSVVNLVAYDDAIHLYKVKKTDFALWIVAFLGTLFLGILFGLVLAVALSLAVVIHESVRPQVSLIWRVKGTNFYRSVKQSPQGEWVQGMLIIRFGAPMYFANMSFIRDTIISLMAETNKDIRYVILEMSPVISVDSSALHIIEDMAKEFKKKDIYLVFANTGNRVTSVMERADFIEHFGSQWFHTTTHSAVQYCLRHKRLSDKVVKEEVFEEGEEAKAEAV